MTLFVSLASYLTALTIAVIVGIIRSNPPAPPQSRESNRKAVMRVLRIGAYNVCTVYVSVMRGIPILVVSAGHRLYRRARLARVDQRHGGGGHT